ncbi:MAG TPA: hypothetical protein VKQ34_03405 [Candidatus Saccharimonadales bacterium]|nr:hypothetical protein [Candidatus Saccharimonadales bacterium]
MQEFTFNPSYRRDDRGVWVLDTKDIPLPKDFTVRTTPHLVHIAPGGWGGNHTHRRREAYVGFGADLYIMWRDETGARHEAPMTSDDGKLHVFAVAPHLPHLVENRGNTPAVLYEILDIDDGEATPLEGADSLRS